MPEFTGFGADTIGFLAELEANNNRDWFKENKHRYDGCVLEPALDFIAAMGSRLEEMSPHFLAIPKRQGGSLMRVYRDTRFHRGAPYKTNIGIQFRHELGKDVHAPGYYLHIETSGCFLAAGMWRPEPGALKRIRERISEHPKAWQRVKSSRTFNGAFEFGGTRLKRPPRGYSEDAPHIEDIKRKDFIAACDFPVANASTAGFVDEAADAFTKARPLMAFLCAAVEVPF